MHRKCLQTAYFRHFSRVIFLWEACFFWYNKGIKTKEKKRGFQCKGHSAARAEVYQDPELPEEDCSQEPRPRKKKATHAELFKGLKKIKSVRYALARWNVSEKNTSAGNSFLLLPNVKFMNTTRKAMAALTVRKERAIRKSL